MSTQDEPRARARAIGEKLYHRYEHTVPVRMVALFIRIDGRDRALMLAGQAFIAVIPILIVVATLTGADGSSAVGNYLVNRFDLDGSAEASVRLLFDTPPDATGGITLISLAVLLITTNSFARSLQRTFAAAWDLSRDAPLATLYRTLGLAVLLVVLFGVTWVGNLLGADGLPRALGLVAQLTAVVGGWALASYLLLSRRRPLRDLLPGAVASALIQLLVGWGTALHLPRLIARNAENYGAIGASLALVTWLIVVAGTIVAGAVVSRILAPDHRTPGTACRADAHAWTRRAPAPLPPRRRGRRPGSVREP